jgi:hypothetical protein
VVGAEATAPAVRTVDVLLTGLEDLPDSQVDSLDEAAGEEAVSEGSREEENPYTPEDALR